MRKLATIEALSRYGKAQGRLLASITIAPQRAQRLQEDQQILCTPDPGW